MDITYRPAKLEDLEIAERVVQRAGQQWPACVSSSAWFASCVAVVV
jgi:hypothetical protein